MSSNILIYMFVFVLVVTVTNADYLNTKSSNQCVYNVQPYQNEKGLCYTKRSNDQNICSTSLRYKHLINGYEYKNSGCYLKNDLELTGLTQSEWDYLLAVLANIIGFTMFFIINFLAVNVARIRR